MRFPKRSIRIWPNELLYGLIDKMMDRAIVPGDQTNFVNLGILTLWQGDMNIPLYVVARTTCDVDYNRAPQDKANMIKEVTEMWRAFNMTLKLYDSLALQPINTRLRPVTDFCGAQLGTICKYDCAYAMQTILERSKEDMKICIAKTLWNMMPKQRCVHLLSFMIDHYPPKEYHGNFTPVSQWTSDYRVAACIGSNFSELDKGQQADVLKDICSRSEYDSTTRAFIQGATESHQTALLGKHLSCLGEDELSVYIHAGGLIHDWEPLLRRVVTNDPNYKGWGLRSKFLVDLIQGASAKNAEMPGFEKAKDPINILLNLDKRIYTVTYAQMLDMAVYMHKRMSEVGRHRFGVIGLVRLSREVLDMIKHLAVIQKCSLYDARYSTMLDVNHELWQNVVKMFEELQPVHTLLDEEFEWLLMYNPHKRMRDEDSDCEDEGLLRGRALIT